MPLSDDTRWTCYRKKSYPTEAIARKVANRIKFEQGVVLNVYGCTSCGRYHLGKHMLAGGAIA